MSLAQTEPRWRAAETAATLAYPLAVHVAVSAGRPVLALVALAAVGLLFLISAVARRSPATAAAAAALLTLALIGLQAQTAAALFLPPVAVIGALLVTFARSLAPGREPVVTRIARLLGDEGAEIARYTRSVTWVWSGFLAVLLIESILLALLAPLAVWSLFVNLLNYLFMALLFAAEYLVRRIRFRHRTTAGWQALARADWGALLRHE